MNTFKADVPCPHYFRNFDTSLAEIAPGKSRSCPKCGEIIKFAGQKRGSTHTDIFNVSVPLGYEDLIINKLFFVLPSDVSPKG